MSTGSILAVILIVFNIFLLASSNIQTDSLSERLERASKEIDRLRLREASLVGELERREKDDDNSHNR